MNPQHSPTDCLARQRRATAIAQGEQREPWVVHTSRENLRIEERRWIGIRAAS